MLRRASENRVFPPRVAAPRQKKIPVRFAIKALGAKHVYVCGDFNQWNPAATALQESEPGLWQTTLSLSSGRHEYKFVIDGQWTHDPTAAQNVPNEFGSVNSAIDVSDRGAAL